MNLNKTRNIQLLAGCICLSMAACSDDAPSTGGGQTGAVDDVSYIGKAVGNFSADEWYPGGELGTTLNVSEGCYEDETPATTNMGLTDQFNRGEMFFERNVTIDTPPFNGLGPASVRKSCIDCHPGYGHGKRQDSYKAGFGNGYLLVIYHPDDGANSNDGPYISEVTGMPQTQAVSPFLPPVDEDKITITWKNVTAMESGLSMTFPNGGDSYELIYPEVTIDPSAFNTYPVPTNYAVRLESTIGIIGTGLIDAIPDDSLKKQYELTARYSEVNPAMWDKEANDWASTAYYTNWTSPGALADGTAVTGKIKRYTYALTRASLQDGAGANAMWNIPNVSRPDRPKLYTTQAWADAMSMNADVISAIKRDPTSPYYADGTDEGIADAVKNLLSPNTNQFDNKWHNFTPDMSTDNFYAFMVWHRGLSIPRARNLNDPEVQRGKKLFMEMGCATCHRPSWTTGDDNYWTPDVIKGRPLPKYPKQKIYPYSDFVQHKLYMANDIHGSWCRTTPLWGRGLSLINTGAEDRLHDCRARNEVEAIMWHCYSKKSQAYDSAYKFYNLPKADRDAVVKFLRSI
ncbi:MAG: di-heme oxidoredictase family protein [Prevotella sp.]|nr:di-heme oxidoredictase family protein [Prevotella sp.]